MTSLEFAITSVTGEPINKSEALRQVRKQFGIKISNRDFLKKVTDMLEMGYQKDVSKNKHEFLIQRVNETDKRTWIMVIESNEKYLKESIKVLSKHKKLFPQRKSKHKYANLPLTKVFADFSKFSLSIDHLMITQIRAKYMMNFGMIRGSVAEDIIKQTDRIIKKAVTKLYEDHPKEKKQIMLSIRKTNRRFDNLMI